MRLARSEMTDTQRFYADVNRTGSEGAHSHDLADSIPSLNVSQRAKDCATKGQEVFTASERRNGRAGSRYWIGVHNAPDFAVPVRPNRGVEGGSEEGIEGAPAQANRPAAPLNIIPAPADYVGPVATVRDYDSDPSGPWREVPWDEENHRPLEAA